MTVTEKILVHIEQVTEVVAPDRGQVGKDALEPPGVHAVNNRSQCRPSTMSGIFSVVKEQITM